MSKVLDAFKIKPFDLEPVYAAWPDCPRFLGIAKKDPPVDEWLEQIKAGCLERKVPKECWHKVAQHYMGDKAKTRLDELKIVMAKVHGGTYRWRWKTFKIAMHNMGWNIESSEKETLKVHTKRDGLWWISRKQSERPTPTRSKTIDPSSLSENAVMAKTHAERPTPLRSSTTDSSISSESTVTAVTHAPVWLLNACQALEFLNTEHPKVMTTLSAILITVGSIPAIPAISAGAGGAVLASGAAHAVGAIAVGVGSWLKTQQPATKV